ncbi:unnamed protein product [Notodromas monacha]|uniref:Bee-milk protein n=1 Tax=Notodromas monacha TaxID=399045 RepID=A0A7R9BK45_9CRUS|nr:unnamed protein product [Notodromas monacha]CAG0916960.1 unnamed protein product [Notodromas monacha]
MKKRISMALTKMTRTSIKEILQVFLLFTAFCAPLTNAIQQDYGIVYEWKTVNFDFPDGQILEDGYFVPENCTLTGLKIYQDRVFVTVPRWASGVPSTLNVVDPDTNLLQAWPSWNMQELGNCSAFQFVQSMEIDKQGRMWTLDTGTAADFPYASLCPAKLIVLDLTTGNVVLTHEFPEEVAPFGMNFLNDVVLDTDEQGIVTFAYITDVRVPGIVVYDVFADRSWRAFHSSMLSEEFGDEFVIQGDTYFVVDAHVDGIAMSERGRTTERKLFYCPLSGFNLYSMDLKALQDEAVATDELLLDTVVSLVGTKASQTDGMVLDSNGRLYFGLMSQMGIAVWNSTDADFEPELIVTGEVFEWIDTFAIDSEGFLWVTTNKLNRFFNGTLDVNDTNFRIIKTFIGAGSYLD